MTHRLRFQDNHKGADFTDPFVPVRHCKHQIEVKLTAENAYGWLSKLRSPVGSPKYQVPYYTKDPKRDHNFDNHPNTSVSFARPCQVTSPRFLEPASQRDALWVPAYSRSFYFAFVFFLIYISLSLCRSRYCYLCVSLSLSCSLYIYIYIYLFMLICIYMHYTNENYSECRYRCEY